MTALTLGLSVIALIVNAHTTWQIRQKRRFAPGCDICCPEHPGQAATHCGPCRSERIAEEAS